MGAEQRRPDVGLGELVDGVPGWLLPVVGALLGCLAGMVLVSASTTTTVDAREIVVTKRPQRTRWARAQVETAVVEGGHLSLRDARDVDLAREEVDGDVAALVDALRRHGWTVDSSSGGPGSPQASGSTASPSVAMTAGG